MSYMKQLRRSRAQSKQYMVTVDGKVIAEINSYSKADAVIDARRMYGQSANVQSRN